MKVTRKVWHSCMAIGMLFGVTQCGITPEPPNEEELITTVRVVFTDSQDPSNTATATFQDLDGPGGDAATVSGLDLTASTSYNYSVEFLNEAENEVEDITLEVEEEGEEHQVFYQVSGANLAVDYGDTDAGGNPIGLTGTATTAAASTGTLTITLRHEPSKAAAGVSDGDITNAGGETDIEVSFDVAIE